MIEKLRANATNILTACAILASCVWWAVLACAPSTAQQKVEAVSADLKIACNVLVALDADRLSQAIGVPADRIRRAQSACTRLAVHADDAGVAGSAGAAGASASAGAAGN